MILSKLIAKTIEKTFDASWKYRNLIFVIPECKRNVVAVKINPKNHWTLIKSKLETLLQDKIGLDIILIGHN